MRRLIMPALLAAALLAGCSGTSSLNGGSSSGSGGSGGSGSGSGGGGKTTLSMGSGNGSSFQTGVIGITTTSLSAGGSTTLQVSIVDQTGALYTQSVTITFNSPCASNHLATIVATPASGGTPASASVTTTTGSASATYSATGCSGTDNITASATANSQSLTATGSVTVMAAAIGSIQFISATPSQITLKGVGSSGGSSTSTVVFKVVDTSGGPRAGATVNFSLNTQVGGIMLSPASAMSDANGNVQTIVSSGTVATTVRVTATTTAASGSSISTQSNALTISTGIPTSANISLAVKCQNVEAWDIDNVQVPVTVSMTDRFSNPVPDGTTANFQTTLGGIDASCQTGSATPGSGQCVVNWFSKAPYSVSGNPKTTWGNAKADTTNYCFAPNGTGAGPEGQTGLCTSTTNGRSPIIVTAIGEESFKDATGSGVFDTTTDTVAWDATDADNNFTSGPNSGKPKPWFDTSEPFLNEWELYDASGTPSYVLGEPYLDFNQNGTRDGPDGMVQSALCTGSLCSTTGDSVAISASNVIILSGSDAYFNPAPGSSFSMGCTSSGAPPVLTCQSIFVSFTIADLHNQQMPNGTTVKATLNSTTGTINGPASYTWPCATAPGGQTFTFNLVPPQSGFQPGSLIITVTTPDNLQTTAFYNITQ